MAGPKETIWRAEEHTLAKHLILKHYLAAWFPILEKWNGRIVYYDGFAGPGRYEGGEEGSPLVALRVAREHRSRLDAEMVFVFVERDHDRAAHLESELAALQLPANFKPKVQPAEFEDALAAMLNRLESENLELAPTFAFIDPFGITGLPFDLIQRLLRHDKCEVLITFMNHVIERWATELPDQTDRLIGMEGAAKDIASAPNRVARARELYSASLRKVSRFVRFFEMRNSLDRPIYDLFFATNHPLGHYRMKEAMWKADESGLYSFSDGADHAQETLFRDDPGPRLAETLAARFRGATVWTEEILTYGRDLTPFLDKHVRRALTLLERGSRIVVSEVKRDGKRRKASTFPDGTQVSFTKRPQHPTR